MSWSWPLFLWGLAVGVIGVAGSYLLGRTLRLSYHQGRAYVGLLVVTACVAVGAAIVPSATLDVAFTAIVAIANFIVPLALLPQLRRRAAAAHACGTESSCGPAACAACPLAAKTLEGTHKRSAG